ncbi:alcohol dehydrogenase catalytic domain-containing protein [Dactylosporangium cerinum]
MWAAQLVAPSTFADVRVPAPSPAALAPGEVLLRVRAGAICGSDMPLFKGAVQLQGGLGNHPDGAPPGPGCPMHEVVGDVVASRHPGFTPGTTAVGWALGQDALADLVVTEGDSSHPTTARSRRRTPWSRSPSPASSTRSNGWGTSPGSGSPSSARDRSACCSATY